MIIAFGVCLIVYLILRVFFVFLDYNGKKTKEKEELALKYFTEDEIKKGIEYHRRGITVNIIWKIIDFLFPIVFFVSGLSGFLSLEFSDFSNGNLWIQVGLFIIVYLIIQFVINLPFRFYFTYILEHKFGFSNMTVKSWTTYNLKQFCIGLIFTTIIGIGVYIIFNKMPFHWVWIIPVFLLVFELIITLIFPYVILPLFYKKTNFERNEYTKPLIEVAEKAAITVKKIYQINESRYSKHTNAFFTGFGPEKSIYLFDTLVKNNTPEQVASVVAHEAGHWKHHHVLKGILIGVIGSFIAAFIIYSSFCSLTNIPLGNVAGLPLILVLLTIISFFLSPLENYISRKFEVTADTYELKATGQKDIFIKSMVQLAKDNRAFLYPHPIVSFWFASHPPMLERIKMAEKFK